uniref:Small protein A n=1 Tax=uncultured bacterium 5H7 TaxID=1701327 RepID=A0A0N9HQX1_9BACT|nr:small protein A [uncultured bacterium 5H7]
MRNGVAGNGDARQMDLDRSDLMQRMGRIGLAAAVALVAATGGCASIKDHRGYWVDTALIESVQPGVDNRTSVERSLGRPTFVSQFGQPAWYYVSVNTRQRPFASPRTTDQTILRIRFDDKGNVAAVDKAGAEKIARLDPDGKKTPTLGRDRGFLEDLFGNIGTVGAPGMGGQGGGAPGGGPNGS